ncbi:hypothetical protein ACFQ4N_11590 [Oceanobacillus iheyensis]|uniref:hypothetical protein n=1 Tax=Oceanobacillus iheyensis TaxID=182710 RepID=UPI003644F07A
MQEVNDQQLAFEEVEKALPYIHFNNDGSMEFDAEGAEKAGVDKAIIAETKADENNVFASCLGDNSFDRGGPLTYKIDLDHCNTKTVIYVLGVGAGIATIAGTLTGAMGNIPATVALGIAGGLMTIGAATLSYYQSVYGVTIYTSSEWNLTISSQLP